MIIVAHWDNPAALLTEKAAKKMLQRWTHTAKCFGVNEIRFVEVDPLPPHNDAEMNIAAYATLDEALKGLKTIRYVEQGGKPLGKLPKNAAFVFGSDFSELPRADISLNTVHGLHADMACGIVLAAWSDQWRSQ